MKIGINGFGRIGRTFFRHAINNKAFEFIINDIADVSVLAHLLKYDSVQGRLNAKIDIDANNIVIDNRRVEVISVKDISQLPWKKKGVDIVVESTGLFVDRANAMKHLQAGAKKVIITAPAKEPDATFVLGVNEETYNPSQHHIISNASCTTNCLAPIAKVLLNEFGFKRGLMTTIHSYTNDQRILDLPHKDLRRARAAALSMIPTTTGAAKAVSLVLPQLKGKLDGMAIRIPTPNVSLVDLVAEIERDVTAEDVNMALQKYSEGSLKGILEYCEEPLVSIDFNGNTSASIVDALSTKVIENRMVKVLSWYDNEGGYSARINELVNYIIKKGI